MSKETSFLEQERKLRSLRRLQVNANLMWSLAALLTTAGPILYSLRFGDRADLLMAPILGVPTIIAWIVSMRKLKRAMAKVHTPEWSQVEAQFERQAERHRRAVKSVFRVNGALLTMFSLIFLGGMLSTVNANTLTDNCLGFGFSIFLLFLGVGSIYLGRRMQEKTKDS